ncbi:hypothetical protein PHLGIDRAFT_53735, partial [Phlebiopsis gigantea 11061_1 CR5-6]
PHQLVLQLEKSIDKSPRIIGHSESIDKQEVLRWHPQLQQCAEREQIILDTVMIMKQIVLLRVEDTPTVQRIIAWYTHRSKTARQLRKTLVDRHRQDTS